MKIRIAFQRRRAYSRGSAIVEASLTLMLFLIVVFSLFDFGFSLFLNQSVVHQARSAARYGAIHPNDTTAIKNMVLYNKTTGSGTGIWGITPASVTVTRLGTPLKEDDRIQVTISGYQF